MQTRVWILALALAVVGCSPNEQKPASTASSPGPKACREDVGDDVRMAGRTAGAAAKTGITAAADGIVQAGSATAGLVEGGKDEAKQRWKEGGHETKANARKNAAETKHEANTPSCR
jgi:hypothetical protein